MTVSAQKRQVSQVSAVLTSTVFVGPVVNFKPAIKAQAQCTYAAEPNPDSLAKVRPMSRLKIQLVRHFFEPLAIGTIDRYLRLEGV